VVGRSLLLIVDDRRLGEELNQLLHEAGCRVGVADDGLQAVRRLSDASFSVVLIDVGSRSGIGEAVGKVRQAAADAGVVLVSDAELERPPPGADVVCCKPLEMHRVLDVVGSLIESRSKSTPG
jgi:DNA-binding response OmpR family regulator